MDRGGEPLPMETNLLMRNIEWNQTSTEGMPMGSDADERMKSRDFWWREPPSEGARRRMK